MDSNKPFLIKDRIKSFGYAFEGIAVFFRSQHNAWIHIFAAGIVIASGFTLKVNATDWCWLIFAMAMVIITEMLNTAIEFLTDIASPEIHPLAKKVKDVSAGAVLLAAIASVLIGLIVFLPKMI
jgi:diacylglycerol kinase (ATP)